MTTGSFEPEPHWETNLPSQTGLSEVYTALFDGIIMGDPTDLYWSGGILTNQPEFFSGLAGYTAVDLADEISQPNYEDLDYLVDEALSNAIRSLEYSEIDFNAGIVIAASKICGFDRQWLASVVRPSAKVLDDYIQPDSKAERKVLRQKGLAAMGALGLKRSVRHPFADKRIFDRI